MKARSLLLQIMLTLIPIILSLSITAFLITVVNADPRAVFEKVWEGAFRDSRSFAQVVNFWIPLTLVSMGLIVTFTAGLWNIGVEGQMMMGAVLASWAALYLPLPAVIAIPFEIVMAMLGGALWAALVAVLKTRLGVHEIFGGVGLNALANVLSIYLISGPWQPPQGGSVHATDPFPDSAVLPPISPDFQVSLLALVIVVVSIAAVVLALRGTRWGLQLKATGKNARSALLLGVPTEQSAVTAMVVCGALAGIAGSYRVLFTYGSLRPLVSGGIGFLGLLVVLLVANRALWVPFVTFAFAAILGGSTRLKVALQLDQSLAGVLQGFLVLAVLLFNGVRQRLQERTQAETDAPVGAGFIPAPSTPSPATTPEAVTHE
jgi:simple sugar transport system permease protein